VDRNVSAALDPPPHGVLGRAAVYMKAFTAFPPNARKLLAATACFWVGLGVFGVLFNLYLVDLGYKLDFVGLLSGLSAASQAGIATVTSILMRRYSARRVMQVSAVFIAVSMTCAALLTNAQGLLLNAIVLGASLAAASIPSAPYIMEQTPQHLRPHLFSAYTATNTIGYMTGSLIGGSAGSVVGLVVA